MDALRLGIAAAGGGAGVSSPDGYVPSCPAVVRRSGRSGNNANPVSMTFLGNTRIGPKTFLRICTPVRKIDAKDDPVVVAGARSADAIGGRGGNGFELEMELIGLPATLLIDGPICNERGGKGADARAAGADAAGCDQCGGDARARGGNGGRAGSLLISAPTIRWGAGSSITVNAGGPGGSATAAGGDGGDCDECGLPGGRGGNATALAGAAGGAGKVSILAIGNPVSPAVILALATIGPGSNGGNAGATGGQGGHAGGDCVIPPDLFELLLEQSHACSSALEAGDVNDPVGGVILPGAGGNDGVLHGGR